MAISNIGNSGSALPQPAASQGAPVQQPQAPVVVPASAPQPQPKPEQLQEAVQSMKLMVESKAPNTLAFSIDDSTGKTIVRITDVQTGEMIRQIPSEEMLAIARSIDKMQGLLLQQEA